MRLNRFLHSLWENGRVQVDRELSVTREELEDSLQLLQNYEINSRLDLPAGLPGFVPETAMHSLKLMYNLCQLTVNRDFSEKLISETLQETGIEDPHTLETAWSADLIFQHLPAIYQIAARLSKDDPLCQRIKELGSLFPLSSVGMEIENIQDDFLLDNPALKIMYLNRIIEKRAANRLNSEWVLTSIEEKLGGHTELCKNLIDRFKREKSA